MELADLLLFAVWHARLARRGFAHCGSTRLIKVYTSSVIGKPADVAWAAVRDFNGLL